MKRNVWEITYIVWIVFMVGLLLFWPARAAEDTERTENHTKDAEERTECVIEEPEEDSENEYIETALTHPATSGRMCRLIAIPRLFSGRHVRRPESPMSWPWP